MPTEPGRERGCFQYGCIGCAGVAGLLLLVTVLPVMLVAVDDGRASREFPRIDAELPAGFQLNPFPTGSDVTDGELPEYVLEPTGTGRVLIDFSGGKLEIVPGEPGDPIRVEGEYDFDRYLMETGFHEADNGDWVFGLSFSGSGSMVDEEKPRVTLFLPADVPFELSGDIGTGESSLELGGLMVAAVDLKLGTGGHKISFSEATPVPMKSLRAEGSTGQLEIVGLGNARPRSSYVTHRIGQLTVDLGGEWSHDSDVEDDSDINIAVRGGIGQTLILVPDTAAIRLDESSWMLGEVKKAVLDDLPEPGTENLPTLNVEAVHRIGELRFDQ